MRLLRAKREYYEALASVQLRGEWGAWRELLARAVVQSSDESISIAEDLLALWQRGVEPPGSNASSLADTRDRMYAYRRYLDALAEEEGGAPNNRGDEFSVPSWYRPAGTPARGAGPRTRVERERVLALVGVRVLSMTRTLSPGGRRLRIRVGSTSGG